MTALSHPMLSAAPAAAPPEASGSLPRFALVIFAAAVFFATIAMADVARAAPASAAHPVAAGSTVAAAPPHAAWHRKHAACERCGVIQTIRRVDTAPGQPLLYEMTVRLHDGSLRTNSNASSGHWQPGDHIMLIGGGRHAPST